MKTCCRCGEEKPVTEYDARRDRPGKVRAYCKACRRLAVNTTYSKTADRKSEYNREYRQRNRERLAKYNNDWQQNNPNKVAAKIAKWAAANRHKMNSYGAKRRAAKLRATPPWLAGDHIWLLEEIYDLVSMRTNTTGIEWHADHVVPLQNPKVCGLHVPWNIQVIPAKINRSKGNRLLETHEQPNAA